MWEVSCGDQQSGGQWKSHTHWCTDKNILHCLIFKDRGLRSSHVEMVQKYFWIIEELQDLWWCDNKPISLKIWWEKNDTGFKKQLCSQKTNMWLKKLLKQAEWLEGLLFAWHVRWTVNTQPKRLYQRAIWSYKIKDNTDDVISTAAEVNRPRWAELNHLS